MAKKRYTPEEIVAKLRQVDFLVSQGQTIADVCSTIPAVSSRRARTFRAANSAVSK